MCMCARVCVCAWVYVTHRYLYDIIYKCNSMYTCRSINMHGANISMAVVRHERSNGNPIPMS